MMLVAICRPSLLLKRSALGDSGGLCGETMVTLEQPHRFKIGLRGKIPIWFAIIVESYKNGNILIPHYLG